MKKFLCGFIGFYQKSLSPFLGRNCRFYPSCSAYAIEAIETKGTLTGLRLAVLRILKCHPFHPGGYDPVEFRTQT